MIGVITSAAMGSAHHQPHNACGENGAVVHGFTPHRSPWNAVDCLLRTPTCTANSRGYLWRCGIACQHRFIGVGRVLSDISAAGSGIANQQGNTWHRSALCPVEDHQRRWSRFPQRHCSGARTVSSIRIRVLLIASFVLASLVGLYLFSQGTAAEQRKPCSCCHKHAE